MVTSRASSAKPLTPLAPESLYRLFHIHKLRYVPIIRGKDIIGYLAKDKVIRQASHADFFKKPLVKQIHHVVCHDLSLESFFTELDQLKVHTLPAVDAQGLTTKIFEASEFNALFRPVLRLESQHFGDVLDTLSLPCFILNAKLDPIYSNKQAHVFLKRCRALSKGKPPLKRLKHTYLSWFSSEVYGVIQHTPFGKIHIDLSSDLKITYTCQAKDVQKGRIYIFIIVSLLGV